MFLLILIFYCMYYGLSIEEEFEYKLLWYFESNNYK